MQRSSRPRRAGAVLVVLAASLSPVLGACSSDDDTAEAPTGPTTTAPEQKISPDAEVGAGLANMRALSEEIAAAVPDTERAAKAADELETAWQAVEGTVKQNEPDLYIDIEDSLALLNGAVDGDLEKAPLGVSGMQKAIVAYLEKHPA